VDQVLFGVGLRLDHPEPRTARTLRDRLFPWTALAPVYPEALWHMAAALPQALVHPTPTFATAEWMLFCRYEAARRFLDPVLNYDGLILRALERFPVQIAGVYFEHLRFRIVDYLDAHGLTEWPDCLGRSRLNYGRPDTTPEQREANRKALLDVIETASYWFGRTLAHIGMSESLNEISSGRPVHYWIGGAGMPGPFTIPVLSLWKGSSRLITPSLHESRPFVTHGWPLPSYPVDVAEIVSVAEPAPAVAPPDAAPAPSEAEVVAARMLQSGILLPST
jgi:hypothetical protein